MSAVRARAVRDVARLGLGERAVDHLPALRAGRRGSSRSGRSAPRKAALICATVAASSAAATCCEAAAGAGRGRPGSGRSAPRRRPSRPWPCRSSRRPPGGSSTSAAWTAARGRRAPCWRRSPGTAARSRGRRRRTSSGPLPMQRPRERIVCVGPLVGLADVAPRAASTRWSGRAVDLDVVVGRVGRAVGQLRARPGRGTGAGTRRCVG